MSTTTHTNNLGYILKGDHLTNLTVEGLLTTNGQTILTGATFGGGSISGATTLTEVQSGTTFEVDTTTSYTITLPTPAAGLNYKFVITADDANAVVINAGGNFLYGTILDNNATNVTQVDTDENINFAAAAVVGDSIELCGVSSTVWYVTAQSSIDGGITSS